MMIKLCHLCTLQNSSHTSVLSWVACAESIYTQMQTSTTKFWQERPQIKNSGKDGNICLLLGCWDMFSVGSGGRVSISSQDQRSRTTTKEWSVGKMYAMSATGMYMLPLKCSLWGLQEWLQSVSSQDRRSRTNKKERSVGEMCNTFAIGIYMLTLKCSLQGLQEWCQQSRSEIKNKEKNSLSGRCIPYLPLGCTHAYVEVCSVGFFSGVVAECQQERSQIKNKEKAMKTLLSRWV